MSSFNSPFTGNVIQPTDVSYRAITLSADTTLSWPINGNATDNYAARIMEVTATTGSLSLSMPPANQASVGQDALIRNVGSNSFTVKDYAGNTIIAITAGQAQYIYITTNATTIITITTNKPANTKRTGPLTYSNSPTTTKCQTS